MMKTYTTKSPGRPVQTRQSLTERAACMAHAREAAETWAGYDADNWPITVWVREHGSNDAETAYTVTQLVTETRRDGHVVERYHEWRVEDHLTPLTRSA